MLFLLLDKGIDAAKARCCCCVRYGIYTGGQLCAEGTVRPRRDTAFPGWQASRSGRWTVSGPECRGGRTALSGSMRVA